MNNRDLRVNNLQFGNILYYIALVLLTIKTVLNSSSLFIVEDIVDDILFFSCIVLIMYKFCFIKVNIKIVISALIIGTFCLYTSYKVGSYHIFISYLVIIGAYRCDKRSMIKYIVFTLIPIILLHVILYIINFTNGNIDSELITKGGKIISTHSLYLGHSNTAGIYLLWTTLGVIYLFYEKIKLSHIVIVFAIFIMIYKFIQSRTFIIIALISIISVGVIKYFPHKLNNKLELITKYGFIIISIVSIMLCIFYNYTLNIKLLDIIFSGRFSLASFAFKTYGITFLGQNIDFLYNYGEISNWSVTRLAIDNMPLRLLINFGIFYILLYSILLYKTSKYTSVEEKLFITLMIIYSFSEIFTINAIICFPLAICGWYFVNKTKKGESKW